MGQANKKIPGMTKKKFLARHEYLAGSRELSFSSGVKDSGLRLSCASEFARPARETRSFSRACRREILSSSALVCPDLELGVERGVPSRGVAASAW
jgi:hypothetical protein